MNTRTSHIVEIVVVVLNSLGQLGAALAGVVSPLHAGEMTTAGAVALALARGLSNIGSTSSSA